MPTETANHITKELEKTFGRQFNREGLKKIKDELLKEPPAAMEAAFEFFTLNSAFLPSPAILLAKVQAEGRAIREKHTLAAEKAERAKIQHEPNALERAARDEHAQWALQGIAMMRRGDKTHEEKLEFFRTMEERYPGIGWGTQGAQLQRYWEQKASGKEARLAGI